MRPESRSMNHVEVLGFNIWLNMQVVELMEGFTNLIVSIHISEMRPEFRSMNSLVMTQSPTFLRILIKFCSSVSAPAKLQTAPIDIKPPDTDQSIRQKPNIDVNLSHNCTNPWAWNRKPYHLTTRHRQCLWRYSQCYYSRFQSSPSLPNPKGNNPLFKILAQLVQIRFSFVV